MANPNIVNVASIYGSTVTLIPANTAANVWSALTPAAGTVNKVGNMVAANVTGSPATVTVSLNSAVAGGGTPTRLAYQISIPANASLIIIDKTSSIYVGESQSIVVTVGTASAIELTAAVEAIS